MSHGHTRTGSPSAAASFLLDPPAQRTVASSTRLPPGVDNGFYSSLQAIAAPESPPSVLVAPRASHNDARPLPVESFGSSGEKAGDVAAGPNSLVSKAAPASTCVDSSELQSKARAGEKRPHLATVPADVPGSTLRASLTARTGACRDANMLNGLGLGAVTFVSSKGVAASASPRQRMSSLECVDDTGQSHPPPSSASFVLPVLHVATHAPYVQGLMAAEYGLETPDSQSLLAGHEPMDAKLALPQSGTVAYLKLLPFPAIALDAATYRVARLWARNLGDCVLTAMYCATVAASRLSPISQQASSSGSCVMAAGGGSHAHGGGGGGSMSSTAANAAHMFSLIPLGGSMPQQRAFTATAPGSGAYTGSVWTGAGTDAKSPHPIFSFRLPGSTSPPYGVAPTASALSVAPTLTHDEGMTSRGALPGVLQGVGASSAQGTPAAAMLMQSARATLQRHLLGSAQIPPEHATAMWMRTQLRIAMSVPSSMEQLVALHRLGQSVQVMDGHFWHWAQTFSNATDAHGRALIRSYTMRVSCPKQAAVEAPGADARDDGREAAAHPPPEMKVTILRVSSSHAMEVEHSRQVHDAGLRTPRVASSTLTAPLAAAADLQAFVASVAAGIARHVHAH
ncbi:hypothetical protein EON66_01335 [archaeon]|nr:MAG: hypothetical protein EON66_01335 [archaeon]